MLPCVLVAVLNKGPAAVDKQDLEDGRFTLPAAATAYALDPVRAGLVCGAGDMPGGKCWLWGQR
jgi:hypothetical protein